MEINLSMTTRIDKAYRKEKLLDWERKSLTGKFSIFSLFNKSHWQILGLFVLGFSALAFVAPFIPPRYNWSNWNPPTTTDEYMFRVKNYLIVFPIMIAAAFIITTIRNLIDLRVGIKRTANFKVTEILNIVVTKILILNGWRLFCIRGREEYFQVASKGQVITIKRTATFRLIDYYIRDEKTFSAEQEKKH